MKKNCRRLFLPLSLLLVFLLPGALAAGQAAAAKPSLSFTNLKTGQKLSNDVFTVQGKATASLGVSNVLYSLNHTGWLPANPANNWTNWSATITLIPGTNQISAWAVDNSGNRSLTNTVKFVYVVMDVLTVLTNGNGTIKPDYNGQSLQIGAAYSMTAKSPVRGFGLRNWTDGSNNIVSTASTLTFIMASNLIFTANFGDVSPPVINARSTSTNSDGVPNDFIVNGVASDNVGVANVYYQLTTSKTWDPAAWQNAISTNLWTNWTASVSLSPGVNYFYAYAVDVNSNSCQVYAAQITYNSAPLKLSGLFAVATDNNGNSLFTVGFGKSTFSKAAQEASDINGVGTYSYVPYGGYASLKYKYTGPPSAASKGSHAYSLTFYQPNYAGFSTTNIIATNLVVITTNLVYATNHNIISTNLDISTNTIATNLVTYVSGTMVFSSVSNHVLTTPSGQLIWSVGSQGDGVGTLFSNRNYFAQTLLTNDTSAGTYTYTSYSPVGSLFKLTDTNGTSYVLTSFADTNYGSYYSENYDSAGHTNGTDNGNFVIASTNRVVNAPLTLANRNLHVFTGADDFNVQFGDSTYSQDSATTNFDNDVGSYTYTNAGTSIGQLNLTVTAPPADGTNNVLTGSTSAARLIFVGGNVGLFTNEDNTFSTFTLSSTTNFVPFSLTSSTLNSTNIYYLFGIFREVQVNQFQFDTNGYFSYNSTNDTPSGTYIYTTFSPTVAMLQLNFMTNSLGTNGTELDWLQLNFNTTNSGNYLDYQFDAETNFLSNFSRTFSIQ